MKIALVGYGKMGQKIAAIAAERGHEIVVIVDPAHSLQTIADFPRAEVSVAIQFSTPEVCIGNIQKIIDLGIPLVEGTTGWQNSLHQITQLVTQKKGSLVWASNFSVGALLFRHTIRHLAQLIAKQPQYDCFIEERHHRHKLDGPSGTGQTIAQDLLNILPQKSSLSGNSILANRAPMDTELSISFTRAGEIPGTHIVGFTSEIDTIEIRHDAHNRNGFALGSVLAAEKIISQKGIFTFEELLLNP